jgi:hypothetical protein
MRLLLYADCCIYVKVLLPSGGTLVPIVISSDKTQLTAFSGNKSAWPVYLTISNINKSMRHKISLHSSILIGYLPVKKLECYSEGNRSIQLYRLFHYCMSTILKPLIAAGRNGVFMDCADRFICHCFPILASYVADNPEQTLIACCKANRCHRCTVPSNQRGAYPSTYPVRDPECTIKDLRAHSYGRTTTMFV